MVDRSGLHAVATGDIIASSELSPEERRQLPDVLHREYGAIQQRAPEALPYELTITGGDGWQCYVDDPSTALAHILHLWTRLHTHGLRSRVALVVDTIDFISENGLNESDGAAFRRSGRLLSDLEADDRWFACRLPDPASTLHQLAAESLSELTDHLLQTWTEAQAQAVAGMLAGVGSEQSVTQTEIAEHWEPEPVTRQTVNRHLKRAHWHRLERTLHRFEQLIGLL